MTEPGIITRGQQAAIRGLLAEAGADGPGQQGTLIAALLPGWQLGRPFTYTQAGDLIVALMRHVGRPVPEAER